MKPYLMANLISILLIIALTLEQIFCENGIKDGFVYEIGIQGEQHHMRLEIAKRRRYLLYEVNHSEGFNLRRDVYMRIANLVLKLREREDWIVVLPPWGHLYHWKSKELKHQIQIPWAHFFDLESLNKHVPVMEFHDYLKEKEIIDLVYSLQYFEDTFKDGNQWVEKYEENACIEPELYHFDENAKVKGWFWGYENVYANNFTCLSLQGQASTIIPLLLSKNQSSIMLDRAEIVLHDSFGDVTYWKARQSMRFAKHLVNKGDEFRRKFLNSTDLTDETELNEDWRKNKARKKFAKGGPYVGIHLRRQDFLYGRSEHLPSLRNAAKAITKALSKLNLTTVFVATDAPQAEFQQLESYLPAPIKCHRYSPSSSEEKEFLKDGGIAIIDQWIASHARYFIGTYESTFTFRIQEEREIMGFHPDTTFNRFCGDQETSCEAPSRWRIVYE